jgi:signal transduction histidine kinase
LETSLFSALTLIYTVLLGGLFLLSIFSRLRFHTGQFWVSLTVGLSTAVGLILLTFTATTTPFGGLLLSLVVGLTLVTYGRAMISNLHSDHRSPLPALWLFAGGAWLVGLSIVSQIDTNARIGEADWVIEAIRDPNRSSVILLAGLAFGAPVLFGFALYRYYTAALPELAHQALYWSFNIVTIWTGNALILSGNALFVVVGLALAATGIGGMLYASSVYRIFDIGGGFRLAARALLTLVLAALIVFVALIVTRILTIPVGFEGNLLLGLIAILAAAVQILVRKLVDLVFTIVFKGHTFDVLTITRKYSQQVSRATEPEQVIAIASEILLRELRVRKATLILSSSLDADSVEFRLPEDISTRPDNGTIALSKQSLIYQQFVARRLPVTQFDLQHSPAYASLPEKELTFFRNLNLSVYAPIVEEDSLIGILACGVKLNDAPFHGHDLELLSAVANHTGAALRNARLVGDLQRLNQEMTNLNRNLEETNSQMQKLDAVKSDFVTIASHELRTPLAQARGYIDIVDALNEQGMLDQDQLRLSIDNLHKATDRMEELIAAMLDVSQIDVNALDLKFAQTTIETVMRMAVEPLTDAIKQRKLTVSVRGLKGLPPIEADLKRLVQAFRNVVLNAIKFTPDGGRVQATAKLHKTEDAEARDAILVTIADTGVGIDTENLELIFQKFYRGHDPGLHSTGTYKFMGAGPGLGLTIARGIIEGHGGKIWAESSGFNRETYPGSMFHILLPLSPPVGARKVMNLETVPGRSYIQNTIS